MGNAFPGSKPQRIGHFLQIGRTAGRSVFFAVVFKQCVDAPSMADQPSVMQKPIKAKQHRTSCIAQSVTTCCRGRSIF